MEEDANIVNTYQTRLKRGLFVWIKESDHNSNWERFRIHSVAKNNWVNLLRQGETEPSHSRQLLSKGRWFVCSSQEPITGVTDLNDLNEIEIRLFKEATGQEDTENTSITIEDLEPNLVDLFEELGVPEGRSKPTLLNEYEDGDQEEFFLQRPNDRDNEETFQLQGNDEDSRRRVKNTKLLQHYLRLEALKETTYKLSDILRDLRENQENIEQIGFGISIVRKYVQMLIETNEAHQENTAIPPGLMQEIERKERELHHEMGEVIQQIRSYNVCSNETEEVCQSLQLATRMYNDQKLMIIRYYYDRRRALGRRDENRRGHGTTQTDVLAWVKKDLPVTNTGEHNPSGNLRENPQRRSTNNDWEDDSVTSEGDEADRRSLTQDGEDEDKVEQRIQNQIRSIRRGNKQIPEELRMTKSDNKKNRQASVFGEHRTTI